MCVRCVDQFTKPWGFWIARGPLPRLQPGDRVHSFIPSLASVSGAPTVPWALLWVGSGSAVVSCRGKAPPPLEPCGCDGTGAGIS